MSGPIATNPFPLHFLALRLTHSQLSLSRTECSVNEEQLGFISLHFSAMLFYHMAFVGTQDPKPNQVKFHTWFLKGNQISVCRNQ